MNLGNSLFHARKKSGLSQEEVAEKNRRKQTNNIKMGNQ